MLKSRAENIFIYSYLLPLIILGLPLGLTNSIAQPLAILLSLPAVFWKARFSLTVFYLMFGLISCILLNSLVQTIIHSHKEYSVYQSIRSFLPFFLLILTIASFKNRIHQITDIVARHKDTVLLAFDRAITIFAVCCAAQTISYFIGLDLANALSKTGNGTRVMIFQTTSCILLSFFAIERRKTFEFLCFAIVLLGTGSKAVFGAFIIVVAYSLLAQFSLRRIVGVTSAILLITLLILFVNPTTFNRLVEFSHSEQTQEEGFQDLTRAYEIREAKKTLLSHPSTLIFGAGFLIQLTPGVPSPNADFAENSKYDIENGYWGVLGKLGILFSGALIVFAYFGLPKNKIIIAALLIEAVMFMKTSYQVFAYMDGVYLLLWCVILSVLAQHPSPQPLIRLALRDKSIANPSNNTDASGNLT